MNLQTFLSEVTSHQKHEENPRVINSNGSDVLVVEYNTDNTIVIYFNDDVVPAPVEMEFKGLDLPLETL